MRKIILFVILLLISGCVHYTPREKAALKAYYHGDVNAFSSLTNEELNVLKAKIMQEQSYARAFSSGATGFSQSVNQSMQNLSISQPSIPSTSIDTECYTDYRGVTHCTSSRGYGH